MMTYKGYVGKVEFDADAGVLHGTVLGIRDVITFEGSSVKEIEKAFRDSVDDYLAFCKERHESPEKPCSGQFVLRLDPELHRTAALVADASGVSLNTWIKRVVSQETARKAPELTSPRKNVKRRTTKSVARPRRA